MRALSIFTLVAVTLANALGCSCADTSGGDAGTAFHCGNCLANTDCVGGACIQYAMDVACAPTCAADGTCPAGSSCATYPTASGEQAMVCVPDAPACGLQPGDDGGTGPDGGMPMMCGGLIGPGASACCTCSGSHCDANGCYGGWWCNTASCRCQPAPTSCPGPGNDAGPRDAGPPVDAGPLPTGTVTYAGGTVSRLFFAVLGDSRPPTETSTTVGYPTPIVQQLYTDIEALSPRPEFALVTGDYCFANPFGTGAREQMALYLGARATYTGTVFYAMGNHECTGGTSSNCGPGSTDGVTHNYSAFLADMLSTIHQTQPYYAIRVDALDGSWTSKILFAAPNAWDPTQDAWLRAQLAMPTTYTFVVHHEPSSTSPGPAGLAAIESIIASAPVTLRITGHSHTYYHGRGTNEVVIGLGGAPPSGRYNYGYLTISQLGTGDIEVREVDYMSGAVNDAFRVHPNGTPAP